MAESLWTRNEAAAFLAVPPATLARWASRGEGPMFYRVGKHSRYRREDVERWLDEQRRNGGEVVTGRVVRAV